MGLCIRLYASWVVEVEFENSFYIFPFYIQELWASAAPLRLVTEPRCPLRYHLTPQQGWGAESGSRVLTKPQSSLFLDGTDGASTHIFEALGTALPPFPPKSIKARFLSCSGNLLDWLFSDTTWCNRCDKWKT